MEKNDSGGLRRQVWYEMDGVGNLNFETGDFIYLCAHPGYKDEIG